MKSLIISKRFHFILIGLFATSSFIWSLISPLGTPPDEYVHAQYAWTASHNSISETLVLNDMLVPKSVASAGNKRCMVMAPSVSASCQTSISKSSELTLVHNFTHGYPPYFYRIIGAPTKLGFSETTWYFMRFISILISTGLLALAVFQLHDLRENQIFLGILLSLTPMVSFMVGSVNPSGFEIISGISLSLLIFKLSTIDKKANSLSRTYFYSVFIASLTLALTRPFSWLLLFFLALIYLLMTKGFNVLSLVNKFKIGLALILPMFLGYLNARITSTARETGTEIGFEINSPALPTFRKILQEQFVGFDNHVYRAIGEFGYLDHRGLELVNTFWSVFYYLALFFAIKKASIFARSGIALLFFGAIALIPLFAFKYIFSVGYGYQSRYAMALICSIPIIAAMNSRSNIFDFLDFRKILIWLVPFSFISDWIISAYRYSHGLPFKIFTGSGEVYYWWLGKELSLFLVFLLIGYILLSVKLIRSEIKTSEK
jgi:hypothetical protein